MYSYNCSVLIFVFLSFIADEWTECIFITFYIVFVGDVLVAPGLYYVQMWNMLLIKEGVQLLL